MTTRFRVNQNRDNLYTNTPSSSGRSTPFYDASHQQNNYDRTSDELESQNDDLLEGLTAKVKLLKDVTIAIGEEVKDSAVQLTQMNDAFAETSGILSGTFNRLKRMSSRQGCRYIWYLLFLCIVFWFFIVVWWLRR